MAKYRGGLIGLGWMDMLYDSQSGRPRPSISPASTCRWKTTPSASTSTGSDSL